MNILYVGVHSHVGWGAEYWIRTAFEEMGHTVFSYDYRLKRLKRVPWFFIRHELRRLVSEERIDILFLQRAERVPPGIFTNIAIPKIFWSTEPIQLKTDVDALLRSDVFDWIFVHSYSCLARIQEEFPHHLSHCSVMHNASPFFDKVSETTERRRFALFNRTFSARRKAWLDPSRDLVECISGRFGEEYFQDLAESAISVNIHFSEQNLDDFESGIFEAMAKDCVVVSERLNPQTVADLRVEDAYYEVASPAELRQALLLFRENPGMIGEYQLRSRAAVKGNTWKDRAKMFAEVFEKVVSI